LVATIIGLATSAASACPMCKDSIAHSDAQAAGALPSGFNYSVYYMLAGLFLTIGLVSTTIVKGIRSTSVEIPPKQMGGRGCEVKK